MLNPELTDKILHLSRAVKMPNFSIEQFKKAVAQLNDIPAYQWFYSLKEKEKPHRYYNSLKKSEAAVYRQIGLNGTTGYLLAQGRYKTEVDFKLETYHLLKHSNTVVSDKPQETPHQVSSRIKRLFSTVMRVQKRRERN